MGYSTHKITVPNALYLCRDWSPVSASAVLYLNQPIGKWRKERNISGAELVDGERRLFLRLKNGDFVEMEDKRI